MMRSKFFIIILMILGLALPSSAQDNSLENAERPDTKAEPMKAVQVPIDKVIEILKDPRYKEEEKLDEQRNELMGVIKDIFDFEKISQLSLGRFRKKLNDEQMTRFIDHFTELLVDTYLNQVQKEFQNEEVEYVEQTYHPSDNERAQVKTLVVRKNTKIPVDYSLYIKDGRWRVYDIRVEGVSLIKNYRTQFEKILLNQSPDVLIEKLEKKNIDTDMEARK